MMEGGGGKPELRVPKGLVQFPITVLCMDSMNAEGCRGVEILFEVGRTPGEEYCYYWTRVT